VQYPLRPAWRGYRIEDATEVLYKPNHRILRISVPEDEVSTVRVEDLLKSGKYCYCHVPFECCCTLVNPKFFILCISHR
jgi:hypothetical protein